jgi:hypothetical protein
MNEQIKLLAEQAGLVRFGDWGMKRWGGPRYDSIGDEDLEKFAELIVRECINCTKEWRDAVRVGSDRDYSRGYVHGCDDAIVEMKIRFGVEE